LAAREKYRINRIAVNERVRVEHPQLDKHWRGAIRAPETRQAGKWKRVFWPRRAESYLAMWIAELYYRCICVIYAPVCLPVAHTNIHSTPRWRIVIDLCH